MYLDKSLPPPKLLCRKQKIGPLKHPGTTKPSKRYRNNRMSSNSTTPLENQQEETEWTIQSPTNYCDWTLYRFLQILKTTHKSHACATRNKNDWSIWVNSMDCFFSARSQHSHLWREKSSVQTQNALANGIILILSNYHCLRTKPRPPQVNSCCTFLRFFCFFSSLTSAADSSRLQELPAEHPKAVPSTSYASSSFFSVFAFLGCTEPSSRLLL